MWSRREFLKRASLVSLYPAVPGLFAKMARAATAESDARALVVIQLDGGNDGINTVVPYADEGYARHRDKLRLETAKLHKLDDRTGFHPQMRSAKSLYDDGRLTVVQGVGYPNPDRSHFRSMRIWQTASIDPEQHNSYGWLGRALDATNVGAAASEPGAIFVGEEDVPVALWGRRASATSLARLEDLRLPEQVDQLFLTTAVPAPGQNRDDSLRMCVTRQVLAAYDSAKQFQQQLASSRGSAIGNYPATKLGTHLQLVAEMIKAGSRARVYYTSQSGYDTHSAQLYTHGELLGEFSGALKAFLDDLRVSRLDQRVAVLAFSEFGRRVEENASQGTDHGTAGPVFLAGPTTIGGLVGSTPDLSNLEAGDVKMTVDFRSVYSTVLEDWLGIDAAIVLRAAFSKVALFRT